MSTREYTIEDAGDVIAVETAHSPTTTSTTATKLETVLKPFSTTTPSAEGSLTPRHVSELRDASMSRASSLDRSSPILQPSSRQESVASAPALTPAPAVAQAPTQQKKRVAGAPPKGIAIRKPANKKRRTDGSGSTTSTDARKPRKRPPPKPRNGDRQSTDLFCICRSADDHTWMIACDGGCDDWFHGKCVNIDEADSELIDKYICPACAERSGMRTTFRARCRLPGCRRPARVLSGRIPSKYCCEEHGVEFMRRSLLRARPEDIPSLSGEASRRSRPAVGEEGGPEQAGAGEAAAVEGDAEVARTGAADRGEAAEEAAGEEGEGEAQDYSHFEGTPFAHGINPHAHGGVLTVSELKALVDAVSTADEFRNLGHDRDLNEFLTMDIPDEAFHPTELEYVNTEKARLERAYKDFDRSRDRARLLVAINHQVQTISDYVKANEPRVGRGLCLFDKRLSLDNVEVDRWRESDEGRPTLQSGEFPHTSLINHDGLKTLVEDYDPNDPIGNLQKADITSKLCLRRRKCERHHGWLVMHEEDTAHDLHIGQKAIDKLEADIADVRRRVFHRMA